jgi:hypothetical protein
MELEHLNYTQHYQTKFAKLLLVVLVQVIHGVIANAIYQLMVLDSMILIIIYFINQIL